MKTLFLSIFSAASLFPPLLNKHNKINNNKIIKNTLFYDFTMLLKRREKHAAFSAPRIYSFLIKAAI